MAPSTSHLQFSDRQVQNVPRSSGNTQFYSRRQASPVERVPFQQHQQSLSHGSQVPVKIADQSLKAELLKEVGWTSKLKIE